MFGLFGRSDRARRPLARRTTRLFLEQLEDRLSPSTGGGGGGGGGSSETITLQVVYQPNKQAEFIGTLANAAGGIPNYTVNLTGVVNTSVTTGAGGGFNVTLPIPKLGAEYAASSDGNSNTAQVTLVGGTPVVNNFTVMPQGSGLWEFSGSVSGAPVQGEVVVFSGIKAVNGQSTAVRSDGTFDYYAIVSTGQGGPVGAEAVDWWGDTSEVAGEYVNC